MQPLKSENQWKKKSLIVPQVVGITTQRKNLFQVTLEHNFHYTVLLEIWYKDEKLKKNLKCH